MSALSITCCDAQQAFLIHICYVNETEYINVFFIILFYINLFKSLYIKDTHTHIKILRMQHDTNSPETTQLVSGLCVIYICEVVSSLYDICVISASYV